MFPGHLIPHLEDVLWSLRSLDLTTCDLFLWGFLKSRVNASKVCILDELKDATRTGIALINESLLQRVLLNFLDRLASCYAQDGRHMLDVLLKTEMVLIYL